MTLPRQTDDAIATRARGLLESVLAIDSASDERSTTIPTTAGQTRLAAFLERYYVGLGASVQRDGFANVLAAFPGRGELADAPEVALLVHLDTARGTAPVEQLELLPAWDGRPVRFARNEGLRLDVETYPSVAGFVGQDLLHGPGHAPFGLDDKLGLTHCMTLAWLLAENPDAPHPPLLLIGRPDEEVGRMEAVEGLATHLAERGVRFAYTVDGILPYEINTENFNAARASIAFASELRPDAGGDAIEVFVGGVNTHGATAKAEGYRSATRLLAEVQARLGPEQARVASFLSDSLRDCDGVSVWHVQDPDAFSAALEAVVGPHRDRGASLRQRPVGPAPTQRDHAAARALAFAHRLHSSTPGFPVAAEESEHRQGYSNPFRIQAEPDGLRLDVRVRDFEPDGVEARVSHLRELAGELHVHVEPLYVNLGPRLAAHRDVVERARRAGERVGVDCVEGPIRGGTGVDPFLDRGVPVVNLGTGYFAPESEKELTSMQVLAGHARWLWALVTEPA